MVSMTLFFWALKIEVKINGKDNKYNFTQKQRLILTINLKFYAKKAYFDRNINSENKPFLRKIESNGQNKPFFA